MTAAPRKAARLHGPPRHHPGRSAGAGGDAALLHRESSATPPAAATPSAGRRGGGGEGARVGGCPGSRQARGDRLHQRGDRVATTWPSAASRRSTGRKGKTGRHVPHRAQGGARLLRPAGEAGMRDSPASRWTAHGLVSPERCPGGHHASGRSWSPSWRPTTRSAPSTRSPRSGGSARSRGFSSTATPPRRWARSRWTWRRWRST